MVTEIRSIISSERDFNFSVMNLGNLILLAGSKNKAIIRNRLNKESAIISNWI